MPPNSFQRLVHCFLIQKPVSWFLARTLYRVDTYILRLSAGRWGITNLVGLPIIQLTAVGAKSGKPRTLPLVGLHEGEKIVLIASNFGSRRNPGWYHNLKANPECRVCWKGSTSTYIARESKGQEREAYWKLARSYYGGYDKYQFRAGARKIPVIVLEPARES